MIYDFWDQKRILSEFMINIKLSLSILMRMFKIFFMCMRKCDQGVYKINDYNVFMEFICIVFNMI